jgi:uncharacterized protein (TIGR00255 family)
MTGYGDSRGQTDALNFRFELRSVNNRHLKITLRAPEPYSLFESEFEKVVRRFVRRGTVLIQLRIDRTSRGEDYRLNGVALQSYVRQITDAWVGLDLATSAMAPLHALLPGVLSLPGVSVAVGSDVDAEAEWPALEAGLTEALTKVQTMRADEGKRMAGQLSEWCQEVAGHLAEIRKRQPVIVTAYRDRLIERVKTLLADSGATVGDHDLVREVAVYADRADIAEEVVRLDSHLQQFAAVLRSEDDGPGRKLEFVAQEMGREINTMGSKAGDTEISRRVVEIKAVMEKIREMLQNVE